VKAIIRPGKGKGSSSGTYFHLPPHILDSGEDEFEADFLFMVYDLGPGIGGRSLEPGVHALERPGNYL
jgi:hypothetical protein